MGGSKEGTKAAARGELQGETALEVGDREKEKLEPPRDLHEGLEGDAELKGELIT